MTQTQVKIKPRIRKKPKKCEPDDVEFIINYYKQCISYFGIDYMHYRIENYYRNPKKDEKIYLINGTYFIISNNDQIEFHKQAIAQFRIEEIQRDRKKNK